MSPIAPLIPEHVPMRYTVLGTDGFGRSDTRAALRDFFEVDARWIAFAALSEVRREQADTERENWARELGLDLGKPFAPTV